MNRLIQRAIAITAVTTTAICACLVIRGQYLWGAGLLVSAVWSIVNFWLITKILDIAILKGAKANLLKIMMFKFPILYITGYWLLTCRIFPIASLLTGMPIALASIGAAYLWRKQPQDSRNYRIS